MQWLAFQAVSILWHLQLNMLLRFSTLEGLTLLDSDVVAVIVWKMAFSQFKELIKINSYLPGAKLCARAAVTGT